MPAEDKKKKPLILFRGFSENLNVRSFFGRKLTQAGFWILVLFHRYWIIQKYMKACVPARVVTLNF